MNDKLNIEVREPLFATGGLSLCAAPIEIAGRKLIPDETRAYCEFKIAFAWPSVTAYGTSLHPNVITRSAPSLQDQVVNREHRMRVHDPENKADDQIIGSVVGFEVMNSQSSLGKDLARSQYIRGAAVLFKKASPMPRLLAEHLSGRHKWTVSKEFTYRFAESGFLVLQRDKLGGRNAELIARTTPGEVDALGYGYVPLTEAPEELLLAYDFDSRSVARPWGGSPVVLFKGGLGGTGHFDGVGLVKYGAERAAEVEQILASDPRKAAGLFESDEAPGLESPGHPQTGMSALRTLEALKDSSEKMLTAIRKAVLPGV